MASCVFSLVPRKHSSLGTIFVRIQGKNPSINIRQTTHLKMDAGLWHSGWRNQAYRHFRVSQEGQFLFDCLARIERTIDNRLCKRIPVSSDEVRAIINGIVFGDSCTRGFPGAVDAYADRYLADIAAGIRLTVRGNRFSSATLASLKVSMQKLKEYQESRHIRLRFQNADAAFFRDYIRFLQGKGYRTNYISKIVCNCKTLFSCAAHDGYDVHPAFHNRIAGTGMKEVDAVYLTRSELDAFRTVDLSGLPEHMSQSRDLFLIGVWTAQRVSDYNPLEKTCIHYETIDDRGTPKRILTLHLIQKKTGKKVIIPCSTELATILDRYPDSFPAVPYHRLNRDIKVIAQMAGINTPVVIRSDIGGTVRKEIRPKYSLVHSHTARRTGATLMYLSGMDVFDICRITGHASIKTLRRYIKADELETARKIKTSYTYFD